MSIIYSDNEKEQFLLEKPQNEIIEDEIIKLLSENIGIDVNPYPEDIDNFKLSSNAEILVFMASKIYKKSQNVLTYIDHIGELTLYSKYRRTENINSINHLSNYIEKILQNIELDNLGRVILQYSEPVGYDNELESYVWNVKFTVKDVLLKGLR